MENERILIPSVLTVITLLHVGLIAALWKMTPPKPMEIMEIEFVDLGGGGGGGAGEPAVSEKAAPEPKPVPPPAVKPKPEPKRIEKKVEAAKPKVAAVKTQNKDADFEAKPKVEAKPKFEPKPEPKPKREVVKEVKPEPQEKAEPLPRRQETFKPSASEYQQRSGSGASGSGNKSEAGNGSGSGEGSGSGKGSGSGSGSGSGKGSGSGSGSGSGKGDGAGSGGVRNIGSFGVPSYPSISRENGEEGTVRLKATVSPGGGVKVEVIKSSGYSRLDNEAKRTVRGSSKFSGPGVYVGNVSFRLNQ